jgi:hypothetical protein
MPGERCRHRGDHGEIDRRNRVSFSSTPESHVGRGHIEIETSQRAYLFLVHAREGVGHKYTMQRRRESEIAE